MRDNFDFRLIDWLHQSNGFGRVPAFVIIHEHIKVLPTTVNGINLAFA